MNTPVHQTNVDVERKGVVKVRAQLPETEKFRSDVLLHLAELAPLQPIMDVPYKFL